MAMRAKTVSVLPALLLTLGATVLLASRLAAAERLYYECTLQRVLSSGGDVVLMVGVEDGQVREQALKVASDPYTVCQMKEHGLKVDGARLSGPMRVQVGPGVEKIELDMALDKGGTHLVAHGCPDAPRKVEGKISIDGPANAASKRWVLWLGDALRPGTRLGLVFEVDREGKKLTAQSATSAGYNLGRHPVDASTLTFDGTKLEGEIGVTIVPARAADVKVILGGPTATAARNRRRRERRPAS